MYITLHFQSETEQYFILKYTKLWFAFSNYFQNITSATLNFVAGSSSLSPCPKRPSATDMSGTWGGEVG